MTRRRQLSPMAPGADVDGLLYLLRDNLRRADAFIPPRRSGSSGPGIAVETKAVTTTASSASSAMRSLSFAADDYAWVRDHAASSLAGIEAAMLRLVTLRTSRNPSHAAARLGMAPVSLFRWLDRRGSLPAAAPHDRAAYGGTPMLTSIAGGAP